jgi:nucleotidyltransferase/DNA polymerase involved in DNA repair
MIACLLIPGFELRAALRTRPSLAVQPVALAPEPGAEPLLGPVNAAAEEGGVRPGMRLSEALATCPGLVLVERDPATVESEWERLLRRLEDAGFGVEPGEAGCVYFETAGVERLYGGVEPALKRALAAVGSGWDARAGAADRRFAALAAASVARPGQGLIVSDEPTRKFLAPLPLSLLPLERERYEQLEELGIRRIGQLAGLPGSAVAERLGPDGRRAWSLARGEEARAGDESAVRPRRPFERIAERLEFPEAVANELTLRRGLCVLVERVLAREERAGRPPRKLVLTGRLVSGSSWRRTVTLREPTADLSRLRTALAPKLTELPAPVTSLRLELAELAESVGHQLELVAEGAAQIPGGTNNRALLREGLRQVRASVGVGGVSTVVEVSPWSRIPEARALLVPRDD